MVTYNNKNDYNRFELLRSRMKSSIQIDFNTYIESMEIGIICNANKLWNLCP